jgi:hypothetical protein
VEKGIDKDEKKTGGKRGIEKEVREENKVT